MAPVAARLEGAEAASRLNTLFNSLEARGRSDLQADGFTEDRISVRRSLDMRYVGQVHECTVDIEPFDVTEEALERLKAAFHARHEELYTYAEPHSAVEVVNVESAITGAVDKPGRMTVARGNGAHAALKGTREMFFSADGIAHETPVYDGALLGAGDRISGPAVIQEVTTTIVIEPGWVAELDPTAVYVLTLAGDAIQSQGEARVAEMA